MRSGKQQSFCLLCKQRFHLNKWSTKEQERLWSAYSERKQTQQQLADDLGKSRKWVNTRLKKRPSPFINRTIQPQTIVLVIDTTYFAQFGVMLFRATNLQKNLLWYEVAYENNDYYARGIQALLDAGWIIEALVADGKPGLQKLFPFIPFQLCQFHQFQTVTRYISKKPKMEASKELRTLLFSLKETDHASFTYWLEQWYERWKHFLNERTEQSSTGKRVFTHRRVRSAYFSLKRHLPYLFTHQQLAPSLDIPNTTNSIDGYFSHLKAKMSVHRGASKQTQLLLINELIFL